MDTIFCKETKSIGRAYWVDVKNLSLEIGLPFVEYEDFIEIIGPNQILTIIKLRGVRYVTSS